MVYTNYKQIPPETITSLHNNPFAVPQGAPRDTVNADNSITGRELPAQLIQVLTQGMQR